MAVAKSEKATEQQVIAQFDFHIYTCCMCEQRCAATKVYDGARPKCSTCRTEEALATTPGSLKIIVRKTKRDQGVHVAQQG